MPPLRPYRTATVTGVFLMLLLALVHVAGTTMVVAQKSKSTPIEGPKTIAPTPSMKAAAAAASVRYGSEGLPAPVLEMRDAILAAVKSGRIEDLKIAIEMNEMKPNFGDGPVPDPIAHLKQASGDGEGRDVLAALGNLLDAGYATLPLGRDLENNRIYVWPYFAETGLKDLTPAQEVELYRLVPPAAAQEMREKGRYNYWRVGIAADGTWHLMSK